MRAIDPAMSAHLWGGIAWVGSTAYSLGAVRVNGGSSFLCVQSGTSAASGGPTGTGTAIVDNTVRWDYAGQANSNVFLIGYLYEIQVRGTWYYLASREVNVSWDNGTGAHTYSAAGALLERSRTRQGSDGSIDDQDVQVLHGGTAMLGGVTWTARYLAGDLAGAAFKVYEARFTTTGTVIGTILRFDGYVGPAQFGSTEGRMVVRALTARLEAQLPRNLYASGCQASLYDSICGLTRPTTWDSATTAAGSATTMVKMASVTQATDYFKLGMVEFLSGALSGLSRTIVASAQSGADQNLTVAPPLPSAPATGVTIRVRRGCSKDAVACDGYGRSVAFLGMPMMPRQDQAR